MGWSDWYSSNGYRGRVSTQEPLLWFSQKISAVPDTACGSEPSLCTEQPAARRPSLEQGLLRGLFRLRHSLDSLLSSPGRHCHGNQALAGHCQQANVGFTKSMLLSISLLSNKKANPAAKAVRGTNDISESWLLFLTSNVWVLLQLWRAGKLPPII